MQPQPSLNPISDLQELLRFHFMQNALLAGTVAAILTGVVGYLMVVRGQSFAGHALSQVGFPGAAGAALVGAPPLWGLLAFCGLAALGIAALSDPGTVQRRRESAAVGSVLALSLALGLLFASLHRGFVDSIYALLFGSFVGVSDSQVLLLMAVAVLVLSGLAIIGRPLLFASIDPDVAAARGVPVRLLSAVFLLLLGLAVATGALITGTLLVFAMLVAPAAAARQLTARVGRGLVLAVAIATLVIWLALAIAYFTVYPIGFFVTSLAFALFLTARAVGVGRRQARVPT